jgi:hypothetical protein
MEQKEVLILVGPTKSRYTIPEERFRKQSKVIADILDNPASHRTLHLPEVAPATFHLYIETAIDKTLNEEQLAAQHMWMDLTKLYMLADRFDDSTLEFTLRCAFKHKAALFKQKKGKFYDLDLVRFVYNSTLPGSRLRAILIDLSLGNGPSADLLGPGLPSRFEVDRLCEKLRREEALRDATGKDTAPMLELSQAADSVLPLPNSAIESKTPLPTQQNVLLELRNKAMRRHRAWLDEQAESVEVRKLKTLTVESVPKAAPMTPFKPDLGILESLQKHIQEDLVTSRPLVPSQPNAPSGLTKAIRRHRMSFGEQPDGFDAAKWKALTDKPSGQLDQEQKAARAMVASIRLEEAPLDYRATGPTATDQGRHRVRSGVLGGLSTDFLGSSPEQVFLAGGRTAFGRTPGERRIHHSPVPTDMSFLHQPHSPMPSDQLKSGQIEDENLAASVRGTGEQSSTTSPSTTIMPMGPA